MSIKNDIEMVKEELTSEEKFFEKSVITEKFVKKYKNVIIGSVVVIVVAVVANIAYDANKASTLTAANEAYNKLQSGSFDQATLARLESLSPSLHDAYLYSKAIADKDLKSLEALKNSKSVLIGDLATYESAKNSSEFTSYSLKQDAVYKELAQIQNAILLMNEGKTQKAHEILRLIGSNSPLAKVASALLHYGVK